MSRRLRYPILSVAAVLVLTCAKVGAEEAMGSFQRTVDVSGAVRLEVMTGAGDITVRRGEAGHVAIVGRIRVGTHWGRTAEEAEELAQRFQTDPPVEVSGQRVRVGDLDDDDYRRNVSISYEIEAPAGAELRSRTGSGTQDVSGISGPVDVAAGSGTLVLADVGAVNARTGSGSIRAERVAGTFIGRTGSGSVNVVQTAPGSDVEVATGSGSSNLSGVDGSVRARSGSGSLSIEGKPSGRWNLETGSGSVHVRVPADAGFELDAHTGSGAISTDHAISVQGTVRRGELSGAVNGGGELVYVRTGSGSIRIE